MSRGRRDGILKNERGRVVVKVGAMHLKGVWITISRAKALAAQFNISDLLHPLFTDDPSIFFYANPPMLPPMPPGYFFPGSVQFPAAAFPPPPPPPPVPPRMISSETNHSMARAPSVPSMVFNNFAQQQHPYAVPPTQPAAATAQSAAPTAPSAPQPSQTSFHYEATSLSDYASRATNGSSSALSESAPPTPCSQQYHHHLHMLHPYDGTSSANTSSTALETPSMESQLLNQYDVDMFTTSPAAYYDEHHITPPQYHQQEQQQEAKWYNYPIQTQQQPLHYHQQPW